MRKKGVSLIELLITVAMIGGVVTLLTMVMIDGFKNFDFVSLRANLLSQTSLTLEGISRDIRLANGLPSTFTYSGQTFNASSTVLILTLPSIDATGQIIPGTNDTIVYYPDVSGGALNELVVPGSGSARPSQNKAILTVLDQVNFAVTDAYQGKSIALTLSSKDIFEGRISGFSLTNTIKTRNL